MKKILFILISLLLIATGVFSQSNAYSLVGAEKFKQLITEGNAIILDVRTSKEFARGHIKGAELIDIYDKSFGRNVLKLPKNKTILIYCATGIRSRTAGNFLAKNGYSKVYDLQRGLMAWNSLKYPLEKNANVNLKPQKDAVSVAAYNQLLQSNKFVLVDFYGPWCAPCKKMMPMIDKLKAEYKGRVLILKVNVDASKELVSKLKVPAVPYFIFYKKNKPVYSKLGVHTREEFVKLFK